MHDAYLKRNVLSRLDSRRTNLLKDITLRTDCTTTSTDLRTKFENAFQSEVEECMQNYTRYDAQSFYDAMIFNMDSLGKYMLELILHQQRTPQLLKQKKLMQTQEDHSHPIPASSSTSASRLEVRAVYQLLSIGLHSGVASECHFKLVIGDSLNFDSLLKVSQTFAIIVVVEKIERYWDIQLDDLVNVSLISDKAHEGVWSDDRVENM
ncbi:hypothetical protein Tco_1129677 [Tanacetum coccineum]